jgi:hypothetical protein
LFAAAAANFPFAADGKNGFMRVILPKLIFALKVKLSKPLEDGSPSGF